MIQNGAGGGGAVSHVVVAEGPDDHLVNSGDSNLTKCLVVLVVLVKDSGGNVMGLSQVGDVGAGRDRWDGGIGAGVDGKDEGCVRECSVQGWVDGKVK